MSRDWVRECLQLRAQNKRLRAQLVPIIVKPPALTIRQINFMLAFIGDTAGATDNRSIRRDCLSLEKKLRKMIEQHLLKRSGA